MGKLPHANGDNIEGAGEQNPNDAVNNANNAATQTSLDQFSNDIEEEVEAAKPAVDEQDWEQTVEDAENAETEYEQEVDSRAERYSEEGYEVVPEEDRPADAETQATQQGSTAGDIDASREQAAAEAEMVAGEEGEAVGETGEYAEIQEPERGEVTRRQPDAREDIDSGTIDIEEDDPIHNEHTIGHEMMERSEENGETFDDIIDEAVEGRYYEDAEAVVNGSEEPELPNEKRIGGVNEYEENGETVKRFEKAPKDPVDEDSLSNDEVHGINLDDIEQPDSPVGGPSDIAEETGHHETVERVASENATDEMAAREAVDRHNNGEAPAQESQAAVDSTDYRGERPWVDDPIDAAPGTDKTYRFIEAGNGNVDLNKDVGVENHQSIAFQVEIGQAQPSPVEQEMGVSRADSTSGWNPEHSDYDSAYEAAADGVNFINDDVDPRPVAQELTPENHDNIGETASENLRSAGCKQVSDLAGATVDDLTSVDGIGESKAQSILENEGAHARKLRETAQQLNNDLDEQEFGTAEFERILEYAAENGVRVEDAADIVKHPNVKKEIPGPTPVDELRAGDTASRLGTNYGAEWQNVDRAESVDGHDSYRPTDKSEYNYQASIKVKGIIKDTWQPNNVGEHQVVEMIDHEGNTTKFTVYKDSLAEPEDETTSGVGGIGTTHPDDGVDPNIALAIGDVVEIENPQVNEYGSQENSNYDGKTIATNPDTTINHNGEAFRSPDEAKVGKKMQPRHSTDDHRAEKPDYREGNSRNLRRRMRRSQQQDAVEYDEDKYDSAHEAADANDVTYKESQSSGDDTKFADDVDDGVERDKDMSDFYSQG